MSKLQKLVIAVALLWAVLPANAQERLSLDLLAYCRHTYGDSAAVSHVRSEGNSWRCTLRGREYQIDMDDVCQAEHGGEYAAHLEDPRDSYTWFCVKRTSDSGAIQHAFSE